MLQWRFPGVLLLPAPVPSFRDSAGLLPSLTCTRRDLPIALPNNPKAARYNHRQFGTASQAGFGLRLLWAGCPLRRIIKYFLETGEGKEAHDTLLVFFSSSLETEEGWSQVPVSDEVFYSQHPRRAWEQATQSILLFSSLNAGFTKRGDSAAYL